MEQDFLHVGTEFLKLEQVGMGLYMLERNFHSWNRTTSIESDSFQSSKFTLKVGTGQNRNLHVGIQLIDDGKGIWKLEYVATGLQEIGKDSRSSNRMEYSVVLLE